MWGMDSSWPSGLLLDVGERRGRGRRAEHMLQKNLLARTRCESLTTSREPSSQRPPRRLFRDDERDFKTVDDLLQLSFRELGNELHVCAVDAPLTIDDASMIYGQMMDQERYGDPADYAPESDGSDESDGDASDGEGVDDAPGDVDYATSQEV